MAIFSQLRTGFTVSCIILLTTLSLSGQIKFKDVTESAGLIEPLKGMKGHGAAWGDVTGNGYPDLFLGTFSDRAEAHYAQRGHPAKAEPDKLFLNRGDGTFEEVMNSPIRQYGRNSGAAFADFDNDGDLDLVVSHNSYNSRVQKRTGNHKAGNFLFENDGKGSFTDVTEKSGLNFGWPFTGRNTFVFDYDGDGYLDLFMQEDWVLDSISGGNSRLMKNTGNLVFKDVTAEAGFPHGFRNGIYGLGGFVGDINGDLWPDLFFAHSCRMFINQKDGTFQEKEYNMVPPQYTLPGTAASGNWTCGADLGDLDNDGDMDMVMAQHFPLGDTISRKLYLFLNEGNDPEGNPILREISEESGIPPPAYRIPHIQLQDMDNDGMVDIMVTVCDEFIYRNNGVKGGIPHFDQPVGSGFKGAQGYWASGPLGDYDRDGKLDFIGPEWVPSTASPLLRNVTEGANEYLAVKLELAVASNRNGIDARVELYAPGKLGMDEALIGTRIITVSNGYSSGYEAIAYFGLPDHKKVDIRVSMPCGGPVYTATSVKRNQLYIIRE
ncbi:MAG: CRTAC1 family protein [Bacteroidota bacterium]